MCGRYRFSVLLPLRLIKTSFTSGRYSGRITEGLKASLSSRSNLTVKLVFQIYFFDGTVVERYFQFVAFRMAGACNAQEHVQLLLR